MRTLIRVALASLVSVVMLVGPVSAATSQAVTVAQATQTGTITGQVTGDSGDGLGAASVLLEGAGGRQTTTTDDSGNFTASVAPGIYTITVNKGGYQTGTTQIAVASGTSTAVNVALTGASLNNLNVIGRTSSGGGGAAKFNISASPIQALTQAEILDRNTPDLTQVVNEIPGVTIPHATSNPNQSFLIRGLRYETKVTLDGHPVSSGTGGTFLTNYTAAAIFGGVDVVKGAGLNGPISGEAGAGLVNLRTPDFSSKDSAFLQGGLDSYGGSIYTALADINVGNKLSFVFGRSFSGYRGPTFGQQEPDYTGAFINTIGGFQVPQNLTNGLVQYINDFSNTYSLNAELAKMRYKFSDATSLSLEFLGLQGGFNPQGGAYGQFAGYATIPQCLNASKAGNGAACTNQSEYSTPAASALIGQSGVPMYAFYPGSFVEQNQPNFNADFKTTFKNDTILFRPYAASINRLIDGTQENNVPGDNISSGGWYEVTNSANCQVNFVTASVANGGAKGPCYAANTNPIAAYVSDPNTPHVYNATGAALVCTATTPCFTTSTGINNSGAVGFGSPYTTLELDKLAGYTFSYIHPVGANIFNVSFDHYYDDTTDYVNDASPLAPGCSFVVGPAPSNAAGLAGSQPTCPLPTLRVTPVFVPETFASVSSLSATAQIALTSKLEFDFGGYFTHYLINAQQLDPATLAAQNALNGPTLRTAADLAVFSGVQNSASHFDPHFGLVFRPTRDFVLRFTGGSSMTIPYASLVSGGTTYSQSVASTTITQVNPLLLPEESVTLDLGSDFRSPDGTVFSGDIYNIVIHNPWLSTRTLICNCALPGLEGSQTFASQTLNGAQQYAQGVEFSITHEPAVGFGYRVNSSFERNYYLGTPPSYFGGNPQLFYNGYQLTSNGSGVSSTPYAKGYAEVQYAGSNKSLFRLGADYEGNNNTYNAPAFFLYDAGVSINTGFHDVMLGTTVENLFNTNFGALLARGVEYQGLQPVVATPTTGGYTYSQSSTFSSALVAPPPITFRVTLTKRF